MRSSNHQEFINQVEDKINTLTKQINRPQNTTQLNLYEVTIKTGKQYSTVEHLNLLQLLKQFIAAIQHETYWIDTGKSTTLISPVILKFNEHMIKKEYLQDADQIKIGFEMCLNDCEEEKKKLSKNNVKIHPKLKRLVEKFRHILQEISVMSDNLPARRNSASCTTTATQNHTAAAVTSTTTTTITSTTPVTQITTMTSVSPTTKKIVLQEKDALKDLIPQITKLLTPTPLDIVTEELNDIQSGARLTQLRGKILRSLNIETADKKSKNIISSYDELLEVYTLIENAAETIKAAQTLKDDTNIRNLESAIMQMKDHHCTTEKIGKLVGILNEKTVEPKILLQFRKQKKYNDIVNNLENRKSELQKYDCFLTVYNILSKTIFHDDFWRDTSTIKLFHAESTGLKQLRASLNTVHIGYHYSLTACKEIHAAIMAFFTACEADKAARTEPGILKPAVDPKLTALYDAEALLKNVFPKEFIQPLDEKTIQIIKKTAEHLSIKALEFRVEQIKSRNNPDPLASILTTPNSSSLYTHTTQNLDLGTDTLQKSSDQKSSNNNRKSF